MCSYTLLTDTLSISDSFQSSLERFFQEGFIGHQATGHGVFVSSCHLGNRQTMISQFSHNAEHELKKKNETY